MDFEKLKVNAKMVLNGVKKSEKIDKYMKIKKEGKLKKFKGKNSLFWLLKIKKIYIQYYSISKY